MTIAKAMKGTTQMSEEIYMTCKHNWVPSNFGIKYRTPNHYMYQCQRCWKTISAILKEKS